MKKLSVIAGLIVALMAINLLIPRLEIEDHLSGFLRENLYRMMSWINFKALA